MLFQLAGKEPKYISVPVALMDFIIGAMELVGKAIPSVGVRASTSNQDEAQREPETLYLIR